MAPVQHYCSTWNLAHSAQQRCHRQTLSEDRKRNHGETDGHYRLALRDFGWKSKGQGQRHCPSQPAPKHDVLMFHRDAKRRARKQKAARIDRDRPAQRHQPNRNNRRKPNRHEILMRFVHSDQKEHQRVRDEGSVFPKRLDSLLPPVGDCAERLEIAHDKPSGDRGQYAGPAEMLRKKKGTVGSHARESDFDEVIVGASGQH